MADEQRRFTDEVYAYMPQRGGQDAHMAPDYPKVLRLGIEGIRMEIEAAVRDVELNRAPSCM